MSQMIEVKTENLAGLALDWAVAQIENFPVQYSRRLGLHCASVLRVSAEPSFVRMGGRYSPSTYWSQGGPLIEKYKPDIVYHSETVLIAACRAIVAGKLGDTIAIPAELLAKEGGA